VVGNTPGEEVQLASPPYEFPSQVDKVGWQAKVNEAIGSGTLRWGHVSDTKWILDGKCPRCGHPTADFHDLEVVVAETLSPTKFGGADTQGTVALEIACLCQLDPPHKKDVEGCGAGKGLVIEVAQPKEAP
jgi:hypothetical protein